MDIMAQVFTEARTGMCQMSKSGQEVTLLGLHKFLKKIPPASEEEWDQTISEWPLLATWLLANIPLLLNY